MPPQLLTGGGFFNVCLPGFECNFALLILYLFSELNGKNQYDDRSNAVGKRFGRLKSKLGFDENYGFYSFRSTLAHLLEASGVAENFAARIIGHKVTTLTYGFYSGDIPWHTKVETLAKISYRPSGWPIKRIGDS